MGNILQGSHYESGIPGMDELTSILERFSKPLIAKDVAPSSPKKRPTTSGKKSTKETVKKKSTHYLTSEVYRELDEANNFLKGLLPPGSKLLSTKSKIVDYAVKMVLEDFDSKGEESELVKKLLKEKNK